MHVFICIFVIVVHCFVQCAGSHRLLEHMQKRQAGFLHVETTTEATLTRKKHPAAFLKMKKREAYSSPVNPEANVDSQIGDIKGSSLTHSRSQRKVLKNIKVVVAQRSLQQAKTQLTFLGETPLFEAQTQLYEIEESHENCQELNKYHRLKEKCSKIIHLLELLESFQVKVEGKYANICCASANGLCHNCKRAWVKL